MLRFLCFFRLTLHWDAFSPAPGARPSSSLGLVTWVMMAGPSMGARRGGRPPARPPASQARGAGGARGRGPGGASRRRRLGAPAAQPHALGEAALARAPAPDAAAAAAAAPRDRLAAPPSTPPRTRMKRLALRSAPCNEEKEKGDFPR